KGCHIDHFGARKRANIGRREGNMPATIKLGDTGDDVKRLQRVFVRTKDLGPDNLDGVFGPQTEKVVKDFQQSNGLVVDGVVGPITWSHLHPIARHHRHSKLDHSGQWWLCSRTYSKPASATRVRSTASLVRLLRLSCVSTKPIPASRSPELWMSAPGLRPLAPRG